MAGRKVFTSGEILTSADVNSFLMDQSVMVFADDDARSSAIPSPLEGMVTYREDANRVEVFDGSTFGPIGGILQVVSTTLTTPFSASLVPGAVTELAGLTASITPSATSSKVSVFVNIFGGVSLLSSSSHTQLSLQLKRGGTLIGAGDAAGSRRRVSGVSSTAATSTAHYLTGAFEFLDIPATTSATTYSLDIGHSSGATQTVYINRGDRDTDSDLRYRGASTITLMEVAV